MVKIIFNSEDGYSNKELRALSTFFSTLADNEISENSKEIPVPLKFSQNFNKNINADDITEENTAREIYEDDITEQAQPPAAEVFSNSDIIEEELIPVPPLLETNTEVDSEGYFWDSRIHARTRAKNTDGTWRSKRGVDQKEIDRIKKQLKNIPQPPTGIPVPPVQQTPPPLPPVQPVEDFSSLMFKINDLIIAGKLTQIQANAAAISVGLSNLLDLVKRPDLIAAVSNAINKEIANNG